MRNAHNLKDSVNKYRNVKGIKYIQWAWQSDDITKYKAIAKAKNISVRTFDGELFIPVDNMGDFGE